MTQPPLEVRRGPVVVLLLLLAALVLPAGATADVPDPGAGDPPPTCPETIPECPPPACAESDPECPPVCPATDPQIECPPPTCPDAGPAACPPTCPDAGPAACPPTDPGPDPGPGATPAAPPAEASAPLALSSIAPRLWTPTRSAAVRADRRTGRLTLARVTCWQGPCTIVAPRRTTLRIAGKRFVARVTGARRTTTGQTSVLRLHLTRAALRRLDRSRMPTSVEVPIEIRSPEHTVEQTVTLSLR